MRTLHGYLIRQTLATLLMTVVVFTFVLLLGNLLKEIAAILAGGQAPAGLVLKAVGLLVPYVLAYSLPMGMLAAVLLVFGRFSSDQELTAARAGGISLLSLSGPLILLSVLMTLLCGWVNMMLAPQCRLAYKTMLFEYGLEKAAAFITENRFITEFPNHVVYVGKKEGNRLDQVQVYRYNAQGGLSQRLHAREARLQTSPDGGQVSLVLRDVDGFEVIGNKNRSFRYDEYGPMLLGEKPKQRDQRPPKLKEMDYFQLRKRIRKLRALGVDETPAHIQLHRMAAFSFACVGFTLIGIPLGIRAHRRETNIGFAMALGLVLVYYALIILAQALENQPALAPHLWMWVPNFLFQAVGGVLLWRINQAE